MIFPGGIGQTVKWLVIAAVAIGIVSFYFHYNSVVSERALLRQNVATAQEAFIREQSANKKLSEQLTLSFNRYSELQKTMQDMADNSRIAKEELEALNGKFRKHDLEELARKKPGLIQNRLNSGTSDAFRMLEESTDFGAQ